MKQSSFFLIAVISLWSSIAHACEGCKMASVNGFKEVQTIQAGIALSWSVLFLLLVVFLLLGIFGWSVRAAFREANAAHMLVTNEK